MATMQAPRVVFMLPQWLPPSFGGRAVAFIPDNVRSARNAAFWAVFLQLTVDLVSIGFGGARSGLATASAIIHGGLAVVAALQLLALLRLIPLLLLFGSVVSTGIPAVFALFLVLMVTLSQGGSNPSDGILAVIFISLLLDFIAGCLAGWAFIRLYLYARACKREDDALLATVVADLRGGRNASAVGSGDERGAGAGAARLAGQGPPIAPAPAPWSDRRRGLQTLQDEHGAVLPPNAGTAVLPLLPAAAPAADAETGRRAATSDGAGIPLVVVVPAADGSAAAGGGNGGGGAGVAGTGGAAAAAADPVPLQPVCDICMVRPRSTAFYPCGHMACAGCAAHVRTRMGSCHLCRRPIRDSMRIFLD